MGNKSNIARNWKGSDPFSLGAYSYFSVNQKLEDYDTLVDPCYEKRLMFAGEATMASAYGCTHSGFLRY